jgi:Fe-Mn family superoxide dismutase
MNSEVDRRQFVEGAALAAVVSATDLRPEAASAQAGPVGTPPNAYQPKPMSFDATKVKGMSEKLLVSHYQNNYSGAVRRLNAIAAQLATLDFATAPVFQINGLKREELIAMNSMILHELYFDGLGAGGVPQGALATAIGRDFGSVQRWRAGFFGSTAAIQVYRPNP